MFHALGQAEAELIRPGISLVIPQAGTLRVIRTQQHPRGTTVFLEGIRRVERARELVNHDVFILRSALPEGFSAVSLAAGLEGLPVLLDGVEVGRVGSVAGVSGHEYVTLVPGGELLPLNAPYVRVKGNSITLLDPPDGLL